MRCIVVLLTLLLPATAVAESDLDGYLRSARTMARRGDCAAVAAVSMHVRTLSLAFHAETFLRDPVIAACEGSRATPPRSPDVAARVDATPVSVAPLERIPGPAAPLERKSGATAISLSIGSTLGGVAALAIAADRLTDHSSTDGRVIAGIGIGLLLVGPTAGHIYAGNAWNRGLQVRLGSLAVATAGIALAWRACAPFQGCSKEERDQSGMFGLLGFVGALGYGGAMLYEIGSAGSSARKYNLRLVPTGNGVGAVGRF